MGTQPDRATNSDTTVRHGPNATRHARVAVVGLVIALVALTACDTGDGRALRPPTEPAPTTTTTEPPASFPTQIEAEDTVAPTPTLPAEMLFEVFAPWRDGAVIDPRYTCDGLDVAPAIAWVGVPDGTVEVAITVLDETADGLVHWIVVGIDPSIGSSPESGAPAGSTVLPNSFGEVGWTGPCPPEGATHEYRVTVHALSAPVDGLDDRSPDELVARIAELEIDIASTSAAVSR